MPRVLRRVALAALLAPLLSCGGDSPGPSQPTGQPTVLGLVMLSAPTASIGVGQVVHLNVAERMSNGELRPVIPSDATWTQSDPEPFTLSRTGVIEARTAGSASVTAAYNGRVVSATIRVVTNWTEDLDFRLAVLDASGSPRPADTAESVLALATDLLFERTGARLRIVDRRNVPPDSATNVTRGYLDGWTGEQPDGVLIWSMEELATTHGGFSTTLARPAPFLNRYPGAGGAGRVHIAAVHFDHMYARCGYDTRGVDRISDRSANGECRNTSGLLCANNGRYWQCPNTLSERYAQPFMFTASSVVHELIHPYGQAGNDDHYATPTCRGRTGMSAQAALDNQLSQWHCVMCPDLFLRFRPAGVPNVSGIAR